MRQNPYLHTMPPELIKKTLGSLYAAIQVCADNIEDVKVAGQAQKQ